MPLHQNKRAQVFGNGSRLKGPVGTSGKSTFFWLKCISRGGKRLTLKFVFFLGGGGGCFFKF